MILHETLEAKTPTMSIFVAGYFFARIPDPLQNQYFGIFLSAQFAFSLKPLSLKQVYFYLYSASRELKKSFRFCTFLQFIQHARGRTRAAGCLRI